MMNSQLKCLVCTFMLTEHLTWHYSWCMCMYLMCTYALNYVLTSVHSEGRLSTSSCNRKHHGLFTNWANDRGYSWRKTAKTDAVLKSIIKQHKILQITNNKIAIVIIVGKFNLHSIVLMKIHVWSTE